jgi:hypothetical protein
MLRQPMGMVGAIWPWRGGMLSLVVAALSPDRVRHRPAPHRRHDYDSKTWLEGNFNVGSETPFLQGKIFRSIDAHTYVATTVGRCGAYDPLPRHAAVNMVTVNAHAQVRALGAQRAGLRRLPQVWLMEYDGDPADTHPTRHAGRVGSIKAKRLALQDSAAFPRIVLFIHTTPHPGLGLTRAGWARRSCWGGRSTRRSWGT